jgi:hypothetical protein
MEKKSLINNLKSTKKANVVTVPVKNEGTSTRKISVDRKGKVKYARFV